METIVSPHDVVLATGNNTLVCRNIRIMFRGIWYNGNPLHFPTPLLLMQLSLISIISRLIDLCLKPLGQSSIVSQIFGGLILGPSFLGHAKAFGPKVFASTSSIMIEMIATFGLMFFFFAIGVKMDPIMMLRPERNALAIGFSVFFSTLILSNLTCFILTTYLPMDNSLKNALPFLATSQSITAFPVIACLLTELKFLNTKLGRLAVSSAMFCDAAGISFTALAFSIAQSNGNVMSAVCSISSFAALILIIAFTIRPALLWMKKHIPEGKSVSESHMFPILVSVLVSGFASEVIGQHFVLGPLIVGLAVPDGPPLGTALENKLDSVVSKLLYPTFLAVSGLKTNIFKIHSESIWIVGGVVIFACFVKITAVLLPAIYSGLPIQEAFVLGLVLNAKGINELVIYNLWREAKILTDQEFSLAVISVLIVTAIITPLIKFLYNPSKQYVSITRNTIQHSKRNAELRILVCLHNQENIPTIINLLQVSHATQDSPVAVIALLLVELVGRTTPIILSQKTGKTLERNMSRYSHIFNALEHYEYQNPRYASVQSFTVVSHYRTMHSDICQIAQDKRATIVIVPFHKQWAIDGSIGSVNRAIQNMNLNVLNNAPCSVGILIDRGINLFGSSSFLTSHSLYHVAVVFVGGADDAEALAYGARMAKHRSVKLTIARFLLFGCENTRDRKQDSNLIDEFRRANAGNEHFVYQEDVVRDGEDLAALVKKMEARFDLIVVGRHNQESPVLSGLDEWCECPELGVIGDMLASPDFCRTSSVLVVQQPRVGEKLKNRGMQPLLNDRGGSQVHDVGHEI